MRYGGESFGERDYGKLAFERCGGEGVGMPERRKKKIKRSMLRFKYWLFVRLR